MLFAEVIGLGKVKAQLAGLWRARRLPHALLINGREGAGGLPLALALAQYVFCDNPTEEDACGKCPSCRKVRKMEHPDLHFSFPTIKPEKKRLNVSLDHIKEFRKFILENPYTSTFDWLQSADAGNRQGNITAEECRTIVERLALKAYEGGMKVLILWRPEYLGKEGNALLKLIEEPPPNTLFIFVSEGTGDILPTILSRMQEVRLPPVSVADMEAALVERGLADPARAAQIAVLAEGSWQEAIKITAHVEHNLLAPTKLWFNMVFTHNGNGIAKFAEDTAKLGRDPIKNFLAYVGRLLHASLRLQHNGRPALNDEEMDFVGKLARMNLSPQATEEMLQLLGETEFAILRNANAKVQLHALSIKMQYIIQNKKSIFAGLG